MWGLARVYARARLRGHRWVVSTMEIVGRGLSVQDEGQAVCRGSPALRGERGEGAVVVPGVAAVRQIGSQARARRARKNPRASPGERARCGRGEDA